MHIAAFKHFSQQKEYEKIKNMCIFPMYLFKIYTSSVYFNNSCHGLFVPLEFCLFYTGH